MNSRAHESLSLEELEQRYSSRQVELITGWHVDRALHLNMIIIDGKSLPKARERIGARDGSSQHVSWVQPCLNQSSFSYVSQEIPSSNKPALGFSVICKPKVS